MLLNSGSINVLTKPHDRISDNPLEPILKSILLSRCSICRLRVNKQWCKLRPGKLTRAICLDVGKYLYGGHLYSHHPGSQKYGKSFTKISALSGLASTGSFYQLIGSSANYMTLELANNQKKTSLRERLSKSRDFLTQSLQTLFSDAEPDDSQLDDIEDQLFLADVGVSATQKIMRILREELQRTHENPKILIKKEMVRILQPCVSTWELEHKPYVVVMVGVNGVGKTTTSAKIAHQLQLQEKTVMFAAADTFRAAAIDQLKRWGERLSVPVISHAHGGDAAAVAHDAYQSALARQIDVLIIDTAGRQHSQGDLMSQLQKVVRVLNKFDPASPHEVMQVLDAGTGQNALSQLRAFKEMVNVSSLCLTKLDGTAKGGILFALAEEFETPVRYLGVGEGMEDLRAFDPSEFVEALLPNDGD